MTVIAEKVKKIVAEVAGAFEGEVDELSTLAGDLSLDSLDKVELVIKLEEGFGLEIEDGDAENIKTVQDIITYVQNHAQ